VLTRWGTHDRGDGVRGVVGAGGGAAATTRRRCGRPMDGRLGALRWVALVQGEPQWVRCRPRRGTHGCMAEPGSSPWAAASTAPVAGWRERDGIHGAVFRAAETTAFLPLETVRASHMATARSRRRDRPVYGGEHGVGTKKGPKARPCLQGYGARVPGCTLASAVARTIARARTRTRRGRDVGAPTRRGGDQTVAAPYG
jgi:hypothetical protein